MLTETVFIEKGNAQERSIAAIKIGIFSARNKCYLPTSTIHNVTTEEVSGV